MIISNHGIIQSISNGFNPISLGDLLAWYKADAGVTLNGSTVSQWNDQSGNNNHITQPTAVNQPTFSANTINTNKPTILFDSNFLQSMSLSSNITGLSNVSFFAVLRVNTLGDNSVINSGSSNYMMFLRNTTCFIGDNTKTWDLNLNTYYLKGGNGSGTTARYFSNGADLGTSSGSSNFDEFLTISGSLGGPDQHFDGNIAEILIYERVLNNTERALVDGYLNLKYAIY